MTMEAEQEHLNFLKEKREKLNNELIYLALQMAEDGQKLHQLKEELRVTNIKISHFDGITK